MGKHHDAWTHERLWGRSAPLPTYRYGIGYEPFDQSFDQIAREKARRDDLFIRERAQDAALQRLWTPTPDMGGRLSTFEFQRGLTPSKPKSKPKHKFNLFEHWFMYFFPVKENHPVKVIKRKTLTVNEQD